MTPIFVVQPEAEAEISEAFRWYEDKRVGLGLEFVRIVEACFAAPVLLPLNATLTLTQLYEGRFVALSYAGSPTMSST